MTRIILSLLFVLPLFFGAVTTPASAAIDANGAAHLKKMFSGYLDDRKAAMKASKRDLRTEGPLTVEPAGTYYAVTMPHITVHNPDGTYTDVGIFAINALPGDKADEWKLTLAFPTPVTSYKADKTPRMRINIGGQTFNGIWNEKVENFTKLDAQYLNVVVDQIEDAMTIKVPKTTIVYNLSPAAGGKTWSGPLKYEMSGIEALRRGETVPSRVGRITLDMNVKEYDPSQAKAYQKKMATLGGKNADGSINPEQLPGIYAAFFDFIGSSWSGFDLRIAIDNIALARPAANGMPASIINVKQAAILFDAKGLRTGAVTSHANISYSGLRVTPPQPGFSDTVPDHLNIDMIGDKIPLKELSAMAAKNILPDTATPEQRRAAGMQLAQLIPQLMTKAGTTIKVSNSSLGTNTYNVLMNGLLNADVKAVMGATGKMRMEITGMEALLKIMQAQVKNPDVPLVAKVALQKWLLTMMAVQAVGQQGKGADGKAARIYDVELGTDGKIMLNGMDLSMLQALAGAAAPATAKKP